MSPPNDNIGSILSQIARTNMRIGFEYQFAATQKTVGKRINSEIDRIIRNDTTPRRLAALQSDYRKLEDNQKSISAFNFDLKSNSLRLTGMKTKVLDAIAAFSSVDANTNLTTAEVSALTAKRDELIKETSALLLTVHPDIATPFVVRDVKNMYETLKAMVPVVGVVDPAGTVTPTNGNRAILDNLNKLSGLIDTASSVTDTTAANASQIALNISASLVGKLTDITSISDVELKRRQAQIADIKAGYANILRTMSISYESRLTNLEEVAKSLNGWDIPPGSVLNLFS